MIRTFGINILSDFDMARIKDPMNRHYVDFVRNKLGRIKEMFSIGNIDAAFYDVQSAIGDTRFLLKSSEDFNRDELIQNVSQRVRDLLPGFDDVDKKQIIRNLATIEKMSEPSAVQAEQHAALAP